VIHDLFLARAHIAHDADDHALLATTLVSREPVRLDVTTDGLDLLLGRSDRHHDQHAVDSF
jgi:hypothetical protein